MCNNPNYIVRFPFALRERAFFVLSLYCKSLVRHIRMDDSGNWYVGFFKFSDPLVQFCLPGLELLSQRVDSEFGVIEPFVYRVPCKKCLGCLSDRRNQWISRCLIESKEYKSNLYITLTYNDQNCPSVLVRKHYQDFFKRLRQWCVRNGRPSPREYYRGEYGHKNHRPHFHAIVFNLDHFDDERILFYMTKRGKKVYHACIGAVPYSTSKTLERLWSHGYVIIAPVVFGSIKYVAKYLDKDFTPSGDRQDRPFNGMSNRPALGRAYFDRKVVEDPLSVMKIDDVKIPVRSVQYYRRLVKEFYPDEYAVWLKKHLLRCGARAKPWLDMGLTELEYLQRREDKMKKVLQLFGHKVDSFYDTG